MPCGSVLIGVWAEKRPLSGPVLRSVVARMSYVVRVSIGATRRARGRGGPAATVEDSRGKRFPARGWGASRAPSRPRLAIAASRRRGSAGFPRRGWRASRPASPPGWNAGGHRGAGPHVIGLPPPGGSRRSAAGGRRAITLFSVWDVGRGTFASSWRGHVLRDSCVTRPGLEQARRCTASFSAPRRCSWAAAAARGTSRPASIALLAIGALSLGIALLGDVDDPREKNGVVCGTSAPRP